MENLLLALHVVAAIFLIGPLVAAANQAARVLRGGDTGALASLARLVTVYGWASLLVGVFGAGLVQDRYEHTWGQAWLPISLVLFLVASALVIGVLAPLLRRAVSTAGSGGPAGGANAGAAAAGGDAAATGGAGGGGGAGLAGRAAAVGGVLSLCYVAIAVLMVYKPGG
jgi:uncharacterized membrane protein